MRLSGILLSFKKGQRENACLFNLHCRLGVVPERETVFSGADDTTFFKDLFGDLGQSTLVRNRVYEIDMGTLCRIGDAKRLRSRAPFDGIWYRLGTVDDRCQEIRR